MSLCQLLRHEQTFSCFFSIGQLRPNMVVVVGRGGGGGGGKGEKSSSESQQKKRRKKKNSTSFVHILLAEQPK